jgi:cellulose biosynthesis protein BcsQ
MSKFDDILNDIVQVVAVSPLAAKIESVTVLRDLLGKARLVINDRNLTKSERTSLRTQLQADLTMQLGVYWGNNVWFVKDRDDKAYRSAQQAVENQRVVWTPPGYAGTIQWFRLERRYSKSAWLQNQLQPPWLFDGTIQPEETAIVSFYSFKGGIGRTTALAAITLLLAQAGKSVCVLDLDLEAPGIGPFLAGDALPSDGILDYLLESQLQTTPPDLDIYTTLVRIGQTPVRVMGSGKLNVNYLEKLARLDFEHYAHQTPPPVHHPLNSLLTHLRDTYHPDFILLDVRAGLHDIGGLSINGLSHLDVIFARNDSQSKAGLDTLLELFGRRVPGREIFLVHGQVPPSPNGPTFDQFSHEGFRTHAFDLFGQFYYELDTQPDIANEEAPYGIPVPFQPALQRISTLAELEPYIRDEQYGFIRLARMIGTYLAKETI